jgi:predicted ATPase/DNA-binding XRE family transcriptional regulator
MRDDLSFGQWLRRRRQALHLTQQQLGRLANCSDGMIKKIEADLRRPSRDVARLLAMALELPEVEHATFVRFARGERGETPSLPDEAAPSSRRPLHPPSNLPVPPSPLIGRIHEVTTVHALLLRADVRLVTLTGPGGVGKTRLSLAVGASLREAFADGTVFVSLGPLTDPALVLTTIALGLGVQGTSDHSLLQRVQANLRDRQTLLLLDNFEHVLSAGLVVADLLSAAPGLRVLVTSREPLHLRGEHEVVVTPLHIPGAEVSNPETLAQYDAVRLFIARAVAAKADFQVTTATASAVAGICARLDGLPLALELAAARLKLLTPEALLRQLQYPLKALIQGARDLPERQQTLRRTIDWSYHLLPPDEQQLFVQLAIFVGGCTLEAAEAVCGADLDLDFLAGLASLVDKSLVRLDMSDGRPRYTMLETIQAYALERLATGTESSELPQRHATYFQNYATTAASNFFGPQDQVWLDNLEAEHDNLRAALRWLLANENAEAAQCLSASLRHFWQARGYLSEGRAWLEAALTADRKISRARARALTGAGWLALYMSDVEHALNYFTGALPAARAFDDEWVIADVLRGLGNIAVADGNAQQAEARMRESLALMRAGGNKVGIALSLINVARVVGLQGDVAQAIILKQEALVLWRELGFTAGVGMLLGELGHLAHVQGDDARAVGLYQESLRLYRDIGWVFVIHDALLGLASIADQHDHTEYAARLCGAADRLRSTRHLPANPDDVHAHNVRSMTMRFPCDDAKWNAAFREGRSMPLEQAIEYALETYR